MSKRILILGGAGFIGSHLVDNLSKNGNEVKVIDNFSTGKIENLSQTKNKVKITKGDLRFLDFVLKNVKDVDLVFHLVANYSVKLSSEDPIFDFNSNALTTLNVLEAMRKNDIPIIIFTSSSTVYGESDKFPIPENTKLKPISNYGASKVSAEMYIHSFSQLYGIKGLILRYANIIGPRSEHGIIPDFVKKLKEHRKRLLILGDGKQKKSYLYVSDCIDASLLALEHFNKSFDVFNVGSEEWITVDEIAKIVCEEMGLTNVKFEYTGGDRGWLGDVSKFLLDIKKLKRLGWEPKYTIEESIRKTVEWLKNH
ncbi:MAG: NAD-dependent epimerase/dehydratase family protein [Candidatus Aenigmarchaeota archaeon]|nr:NAD-dependent epimerase/dehydratase family protein [Candidatus Aenigmarchaeota archaeon]